MYLPPAWVTPNANQIKQQKQTGTGENDYAFLLVSGPAGPGVTLPPSYYSLVPTLSSSDTGEQMLLAAYPAGFLGGAAIQMNLYIASAVTSVTQLYAFHSTSTVDLLAVGGTVVTQSGSSGGAVARMRDGKLNAMIVTDTAGDTTSERNLFAITMAHIERSLTAAGKGGFIGLLSQDPNTVTTDFWANTAPDEIKQFNAVLKLQ